MTGLRVLIGFAAVGSALIGGVFFAFSGFIMPALVRLPAPSGAAAMQSINVSAVGAPLMTALFGTAAAALAVPLVARWTGCGGSTLTLLWLAAGCYLLGPIVVTVAANVPLNNRLAATAAATFTADTWQSWVTAWSGFNLVRTLTGLAAAALYCTALSALQVASSVGD
jgi:uncharacterized membrane protein